MTLNTKILNPWERVLTKPAHPWTNGQIKRMNKTIKEATVKRYYYNSHNKLREHLKTFKGLTPYEFIVSCWENNPNHYNMGPYTSVT